MVTEKLPAYVAQEGVKPWLAFRVMEVPVLS